MSENKYETTRMKQIDISNKILDALKSKPALNESEDDFFAAYKRNKSCVKRRGMRLCEHAKAVKRVADSLVYRSHNVPKENVSAERSLDNYKRLSAKFWGKKETPQELIESIQKECNFKLSLSLFRTSNRIRPAPKKEKTNDSATKPALSQPRASFPLPKAIPDIGNRSVSHVRNQKMKKVLALYNKVANFDASGPDLVQRNAEGGITQIPNSQSEHLKSMIESLFKAKNSALEKKENIHRQKRRQKNLTIKRIPPGERRRYCAIEAQDTPKVVQEFATQFQLNQSLDCRIRKPSKKY